jgi:hypothetical protein
MAILLLTSFTLQDTVPIITAATEKRHLQFMIALWEHRVFMCFDFGAAAAFFLFHQKESCVWSVPIMGALGNLFKEGSIEQARCSCSVPMGVSSWSSLAFALARNLQKGYCGLNQNVKTFRAFAPKSSAKHPGASFPMGAVLQNCFKVASFDQARQDGSNKGLVVVIGLVGGRKRQQ